MEISFCFFLPPAFALANLCITSAVDVLEIAQRGLPVTWTRELYLSVFPQLAVFLCHSPWLCFPLLASLVVVVVLLLLRPHILLGNDANASNCILGLVIYCRSMRIIFTRLPTRFPNVCVCSACVLYVYVCVCVSVHLCRRQQLPNYAAWKEITSISRENLQIFYLQMEMWAQSDRQQKCWTRFRAKFSFKWCNIL